MKKLLKTLLIGLTSIGIYSNLYSAENSEEFIKVENGLGNTVLLGGLGEIEPGAIGDIIQDTKSSGIKRNVVVLLERGGGQLNFRDSFYIRPDCTLWKESGDSSPGFYEVQNYKGENVSYFWEHTQCKITGVNNIKKQKNQNLEKKDNFSYQSPTSVFNDLDYLTYIYGAYGPISYNTDGYFLISYDYESIFIAIKKYSRAEESLMRYKLVQIGKFQTWGDWTNGLCSVHSNLVSSDPIQRNTACKVKWKK